MAQLLTPVTEGHQTTGEQPDPITRASRPVLALMLALLCLAVLFSRHAHRSRHPFDFDPANYSLAVRDFDIVRHQPHPPGCPFFVMAGRAVDVFLHDPNLSLQVVAWLVSCGAVVAVAVATRMAGGGTLAATAAALILATNPVFWMAGEMAEPYTSDVLLVALALALAIAAQKHRTAGALLCLSLVVGFGAGLRPSTGVFLVPVWLWCHLTCATVRVLLANSLIVVVGWLSWFVPVLVDTGGVQAYRDSHGSLRNLFTDRSMLYGATLADHLRMVVRLLLWLATQVAPLVVIALFVRRDSAAGRERPPVCIRAILLWLMLPALLFYATIHFMKPYYILSVAPPLAFAAGLALARGRRPLKAAAIVAAVAVGQVAWFEQGHRLAREQLFGRVTAAAVHSHDARTASNLDLCGQVPGDLPFVFLAAIDREPWPGGPRLLQYYLPEADYAYVYAGRTPLIGRRFYRDEPSVFEADGPRLAIQAPRLALVHEAARRVEVVTADEASTILGAMNIEAQPATVSGAPESDDRSWKQPP